MRFFEFEEIMNQRNIFSLAEMARSLDTTPQAVSNWKARDQIPFHVENKLLQNINEENVFNVEGGSNPKKIPLNTFSFEDGISVSDILITLAQQIKIIFLITFLFVFTTFTYIQFIQPPKYMSWAVVMLPESKKSGGLGGLAGIANQFGVNIPMESSADLSNPSLYPELMQSRTFAEKILDKKFYIEKFSKEMSLLSILTHGDKEPRFKKDTLVTMALEELNKNYLSYEKDPKSSFSIIRVIAPEARFAKNLADEVLTQLESLNRYFKSKTVRDKTRFIDNRITSVERDLEGAELVFKKFNEENRQISSPSLKLNQERLERDVEVLKSLYLTLKQQQELAKIEEIQEASVIQILDKPQIPHGAIGKNLIVNVFLAGFVGLIIGVSLSFVRSFFQRNDRSEKKKFERVKFFIDKKTGEIFSDYRITGFISLILLIGFPFYISYESSNPVFFERYSAKLLFINILYLITMVVFLVYFILYFRKSKNQL